MTVSGETELKESEIGKIPEDWDTISFDKAISNVVDNRGKTAPTSKNGIALIATNCIKENALYPVKEKIRYVSKDTYENWFRDHPKPDDIIIVNKGTPGMVCLVPNPVDFVIAQDMVAVRPNKSRIYGRFLFAFMRSKIFKHEVDSLNVGTTIPHLKKTYFPLLTVPLPSEDEQTAIGDIYYNLSKKIETNLKMNETLEAIGHAVFDRWFVDFEFPNEEGKPYKSSGGEMDSSDFGEVPHGWNMTPFSEVIAVNPIRTMAKNNIATKVEMSDLNPWQPWIESWSKDDYKSGSRFQNGDILFARITPCLENGKTARVSFLNGKEVAFGSTEFIVLGPKTIWSSYYILYLAISKELRGSAILSMTGSSGRQRVPNDFFDNFVVAVPPNELLLKFDRLVASTFERITNNARESRSLRVIRDTLLPRLMSGKIRVPVAKENVEA